MDSKLKTRILHKTFDFECSFAFKMDISGPTSTDINVLCRACMNLLQDEPKVHNYFFLENAPTDLVYKFTNITALQVLLYMKLIKEFFT